MLIMAICTLISQPLEGSSTYLEHQSELGVAIVIYSGL